MLKLGRGGSVSHSDDTVHDGMDAANVWISAGCEAWNGKGAVWQNHTGVEHAGLSVFKAAIIGNGVFSWGWIVPPDRHVT